MKLTYARNLSTTAIRWGAVLAAAVWLGYFICSGMPQVEESVFKPTLILQLVAFLGIGVYATYLVIRRRLPGGSPLDWPLLLLVAAFLAATLTSAVWRVSLESLLILLMAVLVFYVLSDIDWLDAIGLQRALMLAGAVAVVWALWIVAGDYTDWLSFAKSVRGGFHVSDLIPPTVPKVHDVSDHPNILGMILVLIIPFYLLAAFRSRSDPERLGWAIALLAALLTVFLTLSRGAWAGTFVAVAATVAGIAVTTRGRQRAAATSAFQRALQRRSLIVIGGFAIAIVVLLAMPLAVAMKWESRPQWLFRESFSPRQDVFESGVDMFKDNMLLGAGPGTFSLLYPEYSGEYPVHAVHAHNGFLQTAVDAGVVGLAALALLGLTVAWLLWRTYRAGDEGQRLLAVASIGALLGFGVHNLADAANMWKAALVALAAVLALVVKNYRSVDSRRSPSGPPWTQRLLLVPRGAFAIAAVLLFVAWWRIDVPHYHYSDSVHNLATGHSLAAVADAEKAVDADPDMPVYQLQLGLVEAVAFQNDGPTALLDRSIEHLQRAVELEPRGAIGYANLARALAMAGRNDEARTAALSARRFAGNDPTVLLAAGTVLEDIGAADDAVATYAAVITRMSSLADSSFWQETEFRKENYVSIINGSALTLSPCATGYLLSRSEADSPKPTLLDLPALKEGCGALVFGDPNNLDARIDLAEMMMALREMEPAREHLSFVVERQPDMGRARTSMGRWYAANGNMDGARREWLLGAQLGEPESSLLLGNSYPANAVPPEVIERLRAVAATVGGGAGQYTIGIVYFRMKFARESPSIILIPGDWQTASPRLYEEIQRALKTWRPAQ